MGRLLFLRSLCRLAYFSSSRFSTINEKQQFYGIRHHISPHSFLLHRSFFSLSPHTVATSPERVSTGICSIHSFSEDVTDLPVIADPDIQNVFKDLIEESWDELPDFFIHNVKKALSKNTKDDVGQEVLANVFRAAEAVEEFGAVLVSLRMEIDDSIEMRGNNVRALTDEIANTLRVVYNRYTAYLDAFGPDEAYLRDKVETELGTKMTHLKMRCSSLGYEWGKVTGFSGFDL